MFSLDVSKYVFLFFNKVRNCPGQHTTSNYYLLLSLCFITEKDEKDNGTHEQFHTVINIKRGLKTELFQGFYRSVSRLIHASTFQ